MTQDVLAQFVQILGTSLVIAIIIRALMSWISPQGAGGLSRVLQEITDPVLTPIRRFLPPVGGLDLSPLLAIVLIQVVQNLLFNALTTTG